MTSTVFPSKPTSSNNCSTSSVLRMRFKNTKKELHSVAYELRGKGGILYQIDKALRRMWALEAPAGWMKHCTFISIFSWLFIVSFISSPWYCRNPLKLSTEVPQLGNSETARRFCWQVSRNERFERIWGQEFHWPWWKIGASVTNIYKILIVVLPFLPSLPSPARLLELRYQPLWPTQPAPPDGNFHWKRGGMTGYATFNWPKHPSLILSWLKSKQQGQKWDRGIGSQIRGYLHIYRQANPTIVF